MKFMIIFALNAFLPYPVTNFTRMLSKTSFVSIDESTPRHSGGPGLSQRLYHEYDDDGGKEALISTHFETLA